MYDHPYSFCLLSNIYTGDGDVYITLSLDSCLMFVRFTILCEAKLYFLCYMAFHYEYYNFIISTVMGYLGCFLCLTVENAVINFILLCKFL